MAKPENVIEILACLDSPEMALQRRNELDIPRNVAVLLGRSALEAAKNGYYLNSAGTAVDWSFEVSEACRNKCSIAPDDPLPPFSNKLHHVTRVQVVNETTLQGAQRLVNSGLKPLALNFANGFHPGGGFLNGARAQEEVLCRSSALYSTLMDDPLYADNWKRKSPEASNWAIHSLDVPVFRKDNGIELDKPWLLSFITCAAPYAPDVGQPRSGDLLQERILRVLAIARAYGYTSLVLGAWGCGAFGNDTYRTAMDFRGALVRDFCGAFSDVVFAITDWSFERKFIGPFRTVFC